MGVWHGRKHHERRVPHPLRSSQRVGYATVGTEILGIAKSAKDPGFPTARPQPSRSMRLSDKKQSLRTIALPIHQQNCHPACPGLNQHPIRMEATTPTLSSRLPRPAVGPKRSEVEGPAVLSTGL